MFPNKKYLIALITVLFLAAAIGLGTYLVSQKQQAESEAARPTQNLPVLSLTTANSRPAVGSTITVLATIDAKGTNVNGSDLRISYDASKLEAQSIVEYGEYLPNTLLPGAINNGAASIVLACLPTSGALCPRTGTGNLAQITFVVKASGKTKISFATGTAVSIKDSTKNSVGKLNSLQITGH